MTLSRKDSPRRREARRQRAESKSSVWQVFREKYGILPVLIALALCIASTALILAGSQSMPYRLDQRVGVDIRARVAFESKDEKLTRDKKRDAELRTPNVYIRNDAVLTSIRSRLMELFTTAKSSPDALVFQKAVDEIRRKAEETKDWNLGPEAYDALKKLAADTGPVGSQTFEQAITDITNYLAAQHLVEKAEDPNRTGVPETTLLTWGDSGRQYVLTSQLQYITDTQAVQKVAEGAARTLPPPLEPIREAARQLITRSLALKENKYEPIYRYDTQATARLLEERSAAVPVQVTRYKAGDVLVQADILADKRITNDDLALLQKEHDAYVAEIKSGRGLLWQKHLLERIGTATLVILVVCGLASYTARYAPRISRMPIRALVLAVLMLAMLGLARGGTLLAGKETAVFPVVMAAAVLSIVYENRFAFGLIGGLALLATIAAGGGLGLFVTLLTPMMITVFMLRDVRTRSKLITTGALAAIAAYLASAADGFIAGQYPQLVFWQAGVAALSALLAGFIVLGILPAIERIFGVATSLTLLEWCDASRPLLRRLAQEAPGTHSHSLMIGTIAEKAAEAIGANGLLVRVGALYHDLGKIAKPEYYVENQEAKINRHDRLGPTLSHLVIVAHVKDGLELAYEYGLPRCLHQFIAEHHGTTVVKYFHRAAAEQAQKAKTRELPESEFRYPGPKPRSRESAVLMICDSVEGAVRAMQEPTPGRIEATVHQVLMARLNDGQFDDCDITMKDLSRIEDAVVKALCAAYHGRIAYPKDAEKQAAPARTEADKNNNGNGNGAGVQERENAA